MLVTAWWIKFVVILALGVGIALSFPLWTSGRAYPVVPLFVSLPVPESPYDLLLTAAFLSSLVAAVFLPRPATALYFGIVLLAILIVLDQSRLQPWVFMYAFALLSLAYLYTGDGSHESTGNALDAMRVMVCGAYFWAGLQKLNATFAGVVFPWFVKPLVMGPLPDWSGPGLAICVALFEALIGLFLLFPATRRPGIAMSLLMHVVALWALGPFGYRINNVVWPWNVALFVLVLLLFYPDREGSARDILRPRSWLQWLAVLLFICAPVLSYFNRWDAYPSFRLYSGNIPSAYIRVDPALRDGFPDRVRKYISRRGILSLQLWAFGVLNVPQYPEPRVMRRAAAHLCAYVSKPSDLVLEIHKPVSILGRERHVLRSQPCAVK